MFDPVKDLRKNNSAVEIQPCGGNPRLVGWGGKGKHEVNHVLGLIGRELLHRSVGASMGYLLTALKANNITLYFMENIMMRYYSRSLSWVQIYVYRFMTFAGMFLAAAGTSSCAASNSWSPPPQSKNVSISNGGLTVTFNIAWGAVVVGIANKHVAHGLNIVDYHDVGRELQVDQFLSLKIGGHPELMINPTQAGAEGYQAYYQHPRGIVFPEKGSPVIRWSVQPHHFHAVIKPWDYDTGKPTRWVYVEDVRITPGGVAQFHYTFYNHESRTYIMGTEVPTLYSDRTNGFMYPLTNPYARTHSAAAHVKTTKWPVKLVTGAPVWPQPAIISKGWIANVDTRGNLGIFYTTPVGLPETFGTFPGAGVSDQLPLGKTNVAAHLISYPGEIYSIKFSVLVSTPKAGPALISRQPPAMLKILRNTPPPVKTQH